MRRYILFSMVLLLAVVLTSTLNAQDSANVIASPAHIILNRVQMMSASRIESRLPRQQFAAWLQQTLGTRTKLNWQISDCGASTATQADMSKELPTCVEADAVLPDGRTIVVVLDASTMDGKRGTPSVHGISVQNADGSVDVQSLRDLQRILRVKKR